MTPRKIRKKKTAAKQMKSKRAGTKRVQRAAKKNQSAKAKAPKKKAAKRAAPASVRRKKTANREEFTQRVGRRGRISSGMRSGAQTGDLQGLSRVREADSESVRELVEEGNQFEAGAVAGVQEADNADEREVRTHEVPEDDVPEEYLDNE